VERLNAVRNRLAHHLDPGNLDDLLGSVVNKLGNQYFNHPTSASARFRGAALYVCGYFDSIRGSVRLQHGYSDGESKT
jgi:hypothetical protein